APERTSALTTALPMNPVPPVTRYVLPMFRPSAPPSLALRASMHTPARTRILQLLHNPCETTLPKRLRPSPERKRRVQRPVAYAPGSDRTSGTAAGLPAPCAFAAALCAVSSSPTGTSADTPATTPGAGTSICRRTDDRLR